MIKGNKYLKELGISWRDYFINKARKKNPNKKCWKEDKDGIAPAELWNLDDTLAIIIYTYLRKFKDSKRHGYPGNFETPEEWEGILDKMIAYWGAYIKDGISEYEKLEELKEGKELFFKYFSNLWD